MSEATKSSSMSTGRKVWLWTAIVISVIVLILAAGGVIGTWIVRGVAIDVNDGLMNGVIGLAEVGEEASNRIGGGFDELSSAVGEVESAVDEVADNISDKGLVLTLLPPEKEQNLISSAETVAETVNTITASIGAALDLYESIDSIPFVNLPKPKEETIQELDSGIKEIQTGVDQLATDIQDFRDGAATEVSGISAAIGEVNARLDETRGKIGAVEVELSTLQTSAEEFKGKFRTMTFFLGLVVTLILVWVVYAMIILIRKFWEELHA